MTRRRRTGNGAAFAFFASIGGLAIAVLAISAGCSSAFDGALDGRRGGDAVITPTPTPRPQSRSTSPATALTTTPTVSTTAEAFSGQPDSDNTEDESTTGIDDPGDHATMVAAWIYDGDTFRAKTEQGHSVDVRLIGINAPESDECFGPESTNMLIDLIGRKSVEVSTVAFDEYGRRLADVSFDSTDVNLTMVAQGGALALHSDRGDRLSALSQAEEQARSHGLGMWAAGCMAETPITIETVNYDAAGRDDANVNGEWIIVANRGPDIVMAGWGLRDESTRHRFIFPNDFTLGSNESVIIFSGCETDPPSLETPPTTDQSLFWCDPWGPVWTNRGDSAYLTDARGVTVDAFAWS